MIDLQKLEKEVLKAVTRDPQNPDSSQQYINLMLLKGRLQDPERVEHQPVGNSG